MPRQHNRTPVSLEIVLDFSSGEREARISDLSMSGCYIDSIAIVNQGDNINFRLHLPTGQWVQLSGEVIYCLPRFGFGILFTNLSEKKQTLLEQLILSQGGKPWGGDSTV